MEQIDIKSSARSSHSVELALEEKKEAFGSSLLIKSTDSMIIDHKYYHIQYK